MKELENLREKIDLIDYKILLMLEQRFKIVKQIGIIKEKNNLPVEHKSRELVIAQKIDGFTKEHNLEKDPLIKIYKTIIEQSKVMQK